MDRSRFRQMYKLQREKSRLEPSLVKEKTWRTQMYYFINMHYEASNYELFELKMNHVPELQQDQAQGLIVLSFCHCHVGTF
jgi:hypothetical protein